MSRLARLADAPCRGVGALHRATAGIRKGATLVPSGYSGIVSPAPLAGMALAEAFEKRLEAIFLAQPNIVESTVTKPLVPHIESKAFERRTTSAMPWMEQRASIADELEDRKSKRDALGWTNVDSNPSRRVNAAAFQGSSQHAANDAWTGATVRRFDSDGFHFVENPGSVETAGCLALQPTSVREDRSVPENVRRHDYPLVASFEHSPKRSPPFEWAARPQGNPFASNVNGSGIPVSSPATMSDADLSDRLARILADQVRAHGIDAP